MTYEQGPGRIPGASETIAHDQSTEGADTFWSARPVLAHIHQFARARRTAPWATLGVVLARVVTAAPPFLVLPALVGGHGSLNLFIGIVGDSGSGKGAASAAAADAVVIPGGVYRANVGSGEGLSHLYVRRTKEGLERLRDAVLCDAAEIDTLTALGSRNGSTLLPELRKAWSGETLGFSYSDPAKRLDVQAHTYRLALVAGIQPGRAGTLLDDSDGGTPQRFVWTSATDPEAPDMAPEQPEPWEWKWATGGPFRATHGGLVVMPVCPEARAEIDHERLERLRGGTDILAGHETLARLKIAAALAILDGRAEVEHPDWILAGMVHRHSIVVRERMRDHLVQSATEAGVKRAEAEGRRDSVREDAKYAHTVARVVRNLKRNLPRGLGEGFSISDLRKSLHSRDRDYFEIALENLQAQGLVQEVDGEWVRSR